MKTVLVTGGAGFIGSYFIKYLLETKEDFFVVNYDKLTYAGNLNNVSEIAGHPRYCFIKGDICDYEKVTQVLQEYSPDYVVNFAAESHVDRSIDGPTVFGQTNFIGTLTLLSSVKSFWNQDAADKCFLQISTDEVYGSLESDSDCFTENSNLLPNSPYSATKAGADLLGRAFLKTYGLPVIVTRCCNNYGPYQYREKFIPTCITRALGDQPIPIYGNGTQRREWIHVQDHCAAIVKALLYGTPGEIYNIGSGEELSNMEMARLILQTLGKSEDAIINVQDRPGHDRRYALDSSKTKSDLHWSCGYKLSEGIVETVLWYKDHPSW